MPELPEVEVTRRGLSMALPGARVTAVRLGKPLRWPLGRDPQDLVGAQVGALQRRGKYIWLPLDGGQQGQGGLLLHLGMSGSLQMLAVGDAPAAGPHDHFDLETDRGTMRLHDPRRFGAVVWGAGLAEPPASTLLARLGVEPLDADWSGAYLHDALRGRRLAIKPLLLSGEVVVGAGNIYACEALFRAGIHPALAAGRLSRPRCARLADEVRAVLAEAIEAGGSSLRDFKNIEGAQGHFQLMTRVYGRAGEPCLQCGSPVRKIVQGQRATFFCPTCQRR